VARIGIAHQCRGLGVDRDGRSAGGAVDRRHQARVAEARILRLDALDVRDRRVGGEARARRVAAPSTSSCVDAIALNVNRWRRIAAPSLRLERLADAALDPARRERQDVGAPVAAQAPLALLPVEVDRRSALQPSAKVFAILIDGVNAPNAASRVSVA
jgi:hypothetical protein